MPSFLTTVSFHNIGPLIQATPDWLAAHHYTTPTNELDTPFQAAFHTNLHAFAFLKTQPKLLKTFTGFMAVQRDGMPSWLSIYPISSETADWDPVRPVFVDVGGGIGHVCAELKAKYPDLPGEIILEDLPQSIDHALPTAGVKAIAHVRIFLEFVVLEVCLSRR